MATHTRSSRTRALGLLVILIGGLGIVNPDSARAQRPDDDEWALALARDFGFVDMAENILRRMSRAESALDRSRGQIGLARLSVLRASRPGTPARELHAQLSAVCDFHEEVLSRRNELRWPSDALVICGSTHAVLDLLAEYALPSAEDEALEAESKAIGVRAGKAAEIMLDWLRTTWKPADSDDSQEVTVVRLWSHLEQGILQWKVSRLEPEGPSPARSHGLVAAQKVLESCSLENDDSLLGQHAQYWLARVCEDLGQIPDAIGLHEIILARLTDKGRLSLEDLPPRVRQVVFMAYESLLRLWRDEIGKLADLTERLGLSKFRPEQGCPGLALRSLIGAAQVCIATGDESKGVLILERVLRARRGPEGQEAAERILELGEDGEAARLPVQVQVHALEHLCMSNRGLGEPDPERKHLQRCLDLIAQMESGEIAEETADLLPRCRYLAGLLYRRLGELGSATVLFRKAREDARACPGGEELGAKCARAWIACARERQSGVGVESRDAQRDYLSALQAAIDDPPRGWTSLSLREVCRRYADAVIRESGLSETSAGRTAAIEMLESARSRLVSLGQAFPGAEMMARVAAGRIDTEVCRRSGPSASGERLVAESRQRLENLLSDLVSTGELPRADEIPVADLRCGIARCWVIEGAPRRAVALLAFIDASPELPSDLIASALESRMACRVAIGELDGALADHERLVGISPWCAGSRGAWDLAEQLEPSVDARWRGIVGEAHPWTPDWKEVRRKPGFDQAREAVLQVCRMKVRFLLSREPFAWDEPLQGLAERLWRAGAWQDVDVLSRQALASNALGIEVRREAECRLFGACYRIAREAEDEGNVEVARAGWKESEAVADAITSGQPGHELELWTLIALGRTYGGFHQGDQVIRWVPALAQHEEAVAILDTIRRRAPRASAAWWEAQVYGAHARLQLARRSGTDMGPLSNEVAELLAKARDLDGESWLPVLYWLKKRFRL